MRACAIRYTTTIETQQKEWAEMVMLHWCSERCWSRLARFYHDRLYWNSQFWKGELHLFFEWMQTHSETWMNWFQFACWIGDASILKTIHACQQFIRQWKLQRQNPHSIPRCSCWKEVILCYASQNDPLNCNRQDLQCATHDLLELRQATLSNQWDEMIEQYKKT
jgi:hypothetical protein